MVDIANMRPSVLRRLNQELTLRTYAEDFIDSLARYLASAAPDGGVDTDRLYVIGLSLSNAEVWEHISPVDVLARAGEVASETLLAFTAGMPDAIARQFLETQIRNNESPLKVVTQGTRYVTVPGMAGPFVLLGDPLDPNSQLELAGAWQIGGDLDTPQR